MTRLPLPRHLLAADAFEAMVEGAIVHAEELYELDGDTFLRRRNGTIETFHSELALAFDPRWV